jgi:hypothetical protein
MIESEIDKLTKSIEEVATGLSFDTDIALAKATDIHRLAAGWNFDWKQERSEREVYRLIAPAVGSTIQGLISLERREDHVFVSLLECHPQNVGRKKKYAGVAGNLMAFAAKLSQDTGFGGFVAFMAKSELIAHYELTLGASRVGRSARMIIDEAAAAKLIHQYFGGHHGTDS